ncbi:hypothetical protein T09_9330 [Trichinella sp. T9]|nr:hypothetical protein T09_9330 [Trichinella sp. T9]
MRIHALTRKEGSAHQLHSNSNYSYFICQSQYSKRPITLRHYYLEILNTNCDGFELKNSDQEK